MRFDSATVKHDAVADRNVVPENQRAFVPHHMPDGAVLNIRVLSDADDIHVSANDAVVPHAGVVADFHIAYNLRAFGDVNSLTQLRPLSLVLMQHRRPPDKTSTLTGLLNFTQSRAGTMIKGIDLCFELLSSSQASTASAATSSASGGASCRTAPFPICEA